MPLPPSIETGIQHVCQGQGDCVIATLAMIGGIRYDEAEARLSARLFEGWRWPRELQRALEQLTGNQWESVPLDWLPHRLGRVSFPDWPVVVVVSSPGQVRQSHCILVKATFVHDPNLNWAVPMDRYFGRDWRVLAIFQPLN